MIFNSIPFFFFFIIVSIVYHILPSRFKWIPLLAASCYFYMAFVPIYILILGFTIVVDYFVGIFLENENFIKYKKSILYCSIAVNVGVLVFYKYFNFVNFDITRLLGLFHINNPIRALNIILPIGLSFHTFQAMSYTIEVYKGRQKAERHFGIYALYVMFYPQLVAGPIERPQNIIHQLKTPPSFKEEDMVSGLKLMLWGFFKKLVVADRLALVVNSIFDYSDIHNGTTIVIAAALFSIQIYCDFSGYSDIAIGAAKTMGIDLMTNFRRPYFSKSIGEFWTRWHISLSTWFKDYVYIPLGGNRVQKWKIYRNILIVFLISGLWHGANHTFIIWGGLHALFLIVGTQISPLFSRFENLEGVAKYVWTLIRIAFNFILVTLTWIFFRASSVSQAFTMLKHLKSFGKAPFLGDSLSDFGHGAIAIIILFTAEFIVEFFPSIQTGLQSRSMVTRWGVIVLLTLAIMVMGALNGGQFIYFQF